MKDITTHIPEKIVEILNNLTKEFQDKKFVEAIILTGSYARGDFTEFSDVDITLFYNNLESTDHPLYELNYIDNYLISTSKSTITDWKEKLESPQQLLNIYFAIKDSIILFDRNNIFHKLRFELEQDPWAKIEIKRFETINYEIKGYVEEAYKLMRGIEEENNSLISYALFGLIYGITLIVAMHQRLLITTENQLYSELQSTLGKTSKWSKLFREALGIEQKIGGNIIERGKSGLRLFLETLEIINVDAEVDNFIQKPIRMMKQILMEM